MPLKRGHSEADISANIAELVKTGHAQNQAAAIAYRVAGKDKSCALDMAPADWDAMVEGIIKWVSEEKTETEHANDSAHPLRLAEDKSNGSVRSYDADGHLKVSRTPISKANICEYYGHEIPQVAMLGLDPEKKYRLLRDPEELKKGAASSNGKPLMLQHIGVSAEEPQKDTIAGALGTDAEYKHPYLYNSLTVWDQEGIDGIHSNKKRELSCGYRYRADMTPGVYEGAAFDGVMRDIDFNHVALVPEGRAGADVLVGDAKPTQGEVVMTKIVLSRKGVYASALLGGFIQPKLAQDAKFDLDTILKDVSSKNFTAKKPSILAAIRSGAKLATDASLEGLEKLIDMVEKHEVTEGADADPDTALPMTKDEMEEKVKKEAKDKKAKDRKTARDAFVKEHGLDEKACEALDAMMDDDDAADEKPEGKDGEIAAPAKKDAEGEDKAKDMVSKSAMDAAIKSAVKLATDTAVNQVKGIAEAKEFVVPWAGKLALDAKTPEEIHKAALSQLGMSDEDLAGIHPSAYKAVLKAQPLPGARQPIIAQDHVARSEGSSSRLAFLDRVA